MPSPSVAMRSLALAALSVGAGIGGAWAQNVTAFNPYNGVGLPAGSAPSAGVSSAGVRAAPARSDPLVDAMQAPPTGMAFNPWRSANVGAGVAAAGTSNVVAAGTPNVVAIGTPNAVAAFAPNHGSTYSLGSNLPPPPPGAIESRIIATPERGDIPAARRTAPARATPPPPAPTPAVTVTAAEPSRPLAAVPVPIARTEPPPSAPAPASSLQTAATSPPFASTTPAKMAAIEPSPPPPQPSAPPPSVEAPPLPSPGPAPRLAGPPPLGPGPLLEGRPSPSPPASLPSPPIVVLPPPNAAPSIASGPSAVVSPAPALTGRVMMSAATPPPEPPASPAAAMPVTVSFAPQSAEIGMAARAALDALAKALAQGGVKQVELRAYSSGDPNDARKVALARALSVRSYLIDKGVKARIEVGAFAASSGGGSDRVDVVVP